MALVLRRDPKLSDIKRGCDVICLRVWIGAAIAIGQRRCVDLVVVAKAKLANFGFSAHFLGTFI